MTIQQRKYFFELIDKLGYDKKELEARAMAKFGQTDFNLITSSDMHQLITILEDELKASEVEPTITQEEPKGDFPSEFRVWDKMMQEMFQTPIGITNFALIEDNPNRFHSMQWTGRIDNNGKKIFDFDYIVSAVGKRYLVQWGWKECCWVAYDDDNNSMYLASFGKLVVAGNVYSEVKPV